MKQTYKILAHKAGLIRKRYRLSPFEAACASLWLAGIRTDRLDKLAQTMQEEEAIRREEKHHVE